jgi:hypothetical protein
MAYRMIRIASMDGINPEAFAAPLDAESFVVHRISQDAGGGGIEDARLFRCDVLQEMIQWEVADAAHEALSLQFVVSLHDLWSRALVKKHDDRVWWNPSGAKSNKDRAPTSIVKKEESQGVEKDVPKEGQGGFEEEGETVAEEEDIAEVDDADSARERSKKSARIEGLDADASADQAKKELGNKEDGSSFIREVGGTEVEDEKGFAGGGEDPNKRDEEGATTDALEDATTAADDEEDEQETLEEDVAIAGAIVAAKDPDNVELERGKSREKPDPRADETNVDPELKEEQTGRVPEHRRLLETQSGLGIEEGDPGIAFPGMPDAIQEAVRAVFGDSSSWAQQHASISVDDSREAENPEASSHEGEEDGAEAQSQRHSGFRKGESRNKVDEDLWMGLLSSSQTQYFCRIVPFRSLGLIYVEDNQQSVAATIA